MRAVAALAGTEPDPQRSSVSDDIPTPGGTIDVPFEVSGLVTPKGG